MVDIGGYFTHGTGGRGYCIEYTSKRSLIGMFVSFFLSSGKKIEAFRGFFILYKRIVITMV